jgi:protein-S-isoprenylcysteine O-methyltransferase Ste14
MLVKVVAGVIASMAVLGASLFASAWRLDWGMGWAFIGALTLYLIVHVAAILRTSPDLAKERGRIVTQDTKRWDRLLPSVAGVFLLASLVVAGLDVRFGWAPEVALAIQIAALAVMLLGYSLFSWAMVSNRFFSRVVRIQEDRGHAVETGGPYRVVRHPGYVGFGTATLATALALGSLWALIPAGIAVILMIVRTALEDRTLQAELEGYKEYAQRVRYRLLPGVW